MWADGQNFMYKVIIIVHTYMRMFKSYILAICCRIYTHVSVITKLFICISDFFDEPINSLLKYIILGVFTFGISVIVWYMIVKCKDKDEGTYICTVHHVLLLHTYTFM